MPSKTAASGKIDRAALADEVRDLGKSERPDYLKQSPSLRPELPELIADAYRTARLKAADETGLALDVFSESCEWKVAEVLLA